jgi:hypothetical protein
MDYGVLKLQVAKNSSTGLTASLADFDVRARWVVASAPSLE